MKNRVVARTRLVSINTVNFRVPNSEHCCHMSGQQPVIVFVMIHDYICVKPVYVRLPDRLIRSRVRMSYEYVIYIICMTQEISPRGIYFSTVSCIPLRRARSYSRVQPAASSADFLEPTRNCATPSLDVFQLPHAQAIDVYGTPK